ncbi:unnamed protein product, partial [Brachionus calyciflorus]
DLNCDPTYVDDLAHILSFGSKFVPSTFYNKVNLFKNLYSTIDKCILSFNRNLFFDKSNQKHYSNNCHLKVNTKDSLLNFKALSNFNCNSVNLATVHF